MANEKVSLDIIFEGHDKTGQAFTQFEGHLRTSKAATASFNEKWGETAQLSRRVGVGMVAAGAAMTAALGAATKAAMKQEDAENRLRVIYGKGADELIKYAAAIQDKTRFADEDMIAATAVGSTYTEMRDTMKQAMVAAANLSEATGTDLVAAMNMLGKTASGTVSNLREVGVMVDENDFKARGMQAVYDQLAKEEKNVAFEAQSASKAFQQLKNLAGDLLEAIGGRLLSDTGGLIERLKGMTKAAISFVDTPLGGELTRIATATGPVLLGLGSILMIAPSVAAGFETMTAAWAAMSVAFTASPIGWVIIGLTALAAVIVALTVKHQAHQREIEKTMADYADLADASDDVADAHKDVAKAVDAANKALADADEKARMARRAYRDATWALEDAREASQDANDAIGRAEQEKKEAVEAAERAVGEAALAAARAVEEASGRVIEAGQRVADARQDLADAIAEAEKTGQDKIQQAKDRYARLVEAERRRGLSREEQDRLRALDRAKAIQEAKEAIGQAELEAAEGVEKARIAGQKRLDDALEAQIKAQKALSEQIIASKKVVLDAKAAQAQAEEDATARVEKAIENNIKAQQRLTRAIERETAKQQAARDELRAAQEEQEKVREQQQSAARGEAAAGKAKWKPPVEGMTPKEAQGKYARDLSNAEKALAAAEKKRDWWDKHIDRLRKRAKRPLWPDTPEKLRTGIEESLKIRNRYAAQAEEAMQAIQGIQSEMSKVPGRAGGGPVTKGRAYVIGERGPELFVPEQSGSVLPAGAGGVRGGDSHVYIHLADGLVVERLKGRQGQAAVVQIIDKRISQLGAMPASQYAQ